MEDWQKGQRIVGEPQYSTRQKYGAYMSLDAIMKRRLKMLNPGALNTTAHTCNESTV
jgi:hypothetical protein